MPKDNHTVKMNKETTMNSTFMKGCKRVEVFENGMMFLGDSLEILPQLDRDSIEVAVTSPPYNLNKRYSTGGNTKTAKSMTEKYGRWYADDLPEWEYQGQQQTLVHEMMRVCKSSIFYNHKIRYAWHGRNVYRPESKIHHPMHWLHRFPIWCEIIWDRCGIGNPTNRYHIQEERIYQIQKPKKWNNKELKLTNIWRVPPTRNNGHVCSYPPKIVENCILPTTNVGDTILDPYMGSGTTALVAIKHGRKFVGIERNEEYFDLACERISQAEKEVK